MSQDPEVISAKLRLQNKTKAALQIGSPSTKSAGFTDWERPVAELSRQIERAAEEGLWETVAEYPDLPPSAIAKIAQECKRKYHDIMFVVSDGHATITASWYVSNEV